MQPHSNDQLYDSQLTPIHIDTNQIQARDETTKETLKEAPEGFKSGLHYGELTSGLVEEPDSYGESIYSTFEIITG